jgi:nucleotidyltransferase substrate binding protein (TIGR01987 family)
MNIETVFLDRCIATLEKAYTILKSDNNDELTYELCRSACVKEFELILEQSSKLLRKVLKLYFHSSNAVDKLMFKDVFRQAVLRDLVTTESCERWFAYRDNRNATAHDYGENFAEEILVLLPGFIDDAKALSVMIQSHNEN